MLTKKDYIVIAEILRDMNIIDEMNYDLISKGELVSRLSEYFKADNPDFDDPRFRKAVYGGK